jgi:hypothetical protein
MFGQVRTCKIDLILRHYEVQKPVGQQIVNVRVCFDGEIHFAADLGEALQGQDLGHADDTCVPLVICNIRIMSASK